MTNVEQNNIVRCGVWDRTVEIKSNRGKWTRAKRATDPSERESWLAENGKRILWYLFIGSMHIMSIVSNMCNSVFIWHSLLFVVTHAYIYSRHTSTHTHAFDLFGGIMVVLVAVIILLCVCICVRVCGSQQYTEWQTSFSSIATLRTKLMRFILHHQMLLRFYFFECVHIFVGIPCVGTAWHETLIWDGAALNQVSLLLPTNTTRHKWFSNRIYSLHCVQVSYLFLSMLTDWMVSSLSSSSSSFVLKNVSFEISFHFASRIQCHSLIFFRNNFIMIRKSNEWILTIEITDSQFHDVRVRV